MIRISKKELWIRLIELEDQLMYFDTRINKLEKLVKKLEKDKK